MTSRTVEERLSELEAKMARLLNEPEAPGELKPWWQQWFGAFKDNPDFDATMDRGAEYRRSLPTAEEENHVSA